jgi:hypothetical protein
MKKIINLKNSIENLLKVISIIVLSNTRLMAKMVEKMKMRLENMIYLSKEEI